ncbi:MAG: thiol:disulfide interchange protein [Verrucomicrobia bacterium]|nr:thiol:disulfide interchange protein [Verrucomicrobiota bacterium]
MRFQILGLPALLALALQAGWAAPSARTPQATVDLFTGQSSPGFPLTVGIRFQPEPGWHIYWSNPGDSGMPPSVKWNLPPGFSAGPLRFPFPEKILTPPLVSYGYQNETVLLTEIAPPADWKSGPVKLVAELDWLVCKEACLPGRARLDLTYPPGPSAMDGEIEKARHALPVRIPSLQIQAGQTEGFLELSWQALSETGSVAYFPAEAGWVDEFRPAKNIREGHRQTLRIPLVEKARLPQTISGLLVAEKPWDTAGHRSIEISTPWITNSAATMGWPLLFLFAFLGGLILNVMPCVFPILSLKALHLVQISGESRSSARREGMAFGAGVLLSLLFLAGLLLLLRSSGHALGWGFQLQSPPVVWLLLALLLALSLNLLGQFEFPVLLSGLAAKNSGHGWTGALASGLLAVAVASPCTAPFMGVALAAAFALPPAGTLLVFSSLALGFALPVLLFSFFPGVLSFLPKPGAWMNTFKKILSLPMFGAVGWLLWVLLRLCGAPVFPLLLLSCLILTTGLVLYGRAQGTFPPCKRLKIVGLLLLALSILLPLPRLHTAVAGIPAIHADRLPWSEEEVSRQLASGRTVLIDFTAAWCLTCQVNERLVLSRPEVRDALRRKNIAFLVADWTRRDPGITAALQKYGREGVPTYVILRPDSSAPVLLPEILTPKLVLEALPHQ